MINKIIIKKLFVLLLTTNNHFLVLLMIPNLKNLPEIEIKTYRFNYC